MGVINTRPNNWGSLTAVLRRIDERLSELYSIHGKKLARGGTDYPRSSYSVSDDSSDNFSTTSTTYVDVPNVSLTITTNGRPVFLSCIGGEPEGFRSALYALKSAADGSSATAMFKLLRNGVEVYETDLTVHEGHVGLLTYTSCPPGAISYVDVVPPGTYTYKLQCRCLLASDGLGVTNVKLSAFEI